MDKPSARIRPGSIPPKPSIVVCRLEIYLKSGHTIKVVCEDWTFRVNNLTGEYEGYHFVGLIKPKKLGIVPNQIVGYKSND